MDRSIDGYVLYFDDGGALSGIAVSGEGVGCEDGGPIRFGDVPDCEWIVEYDYCDEPCAFPLEDFCNATSCPESEEDVIELLRMQVLECTEESSEDLFVGYGTGTCGGEGRFVLSRWATYAEMNQYYFDDIGQLLGVIHTDDRGIVCTFGEPPACDEELEFDSCPEVPSSPRDEAEQCSVEDNVLFVVTGGEWFSEGHYLVITRAELEAATQAGVSGTMFFSRGGGHVHEVRIYSEQAQILLDGGEALVEASGGPMQTPDHAHSLDVRLCAE
jgi:hypothetical protein